MLEQLSRKLAATGEVDVLSFAAITTASDEADIKHAPRLTNFRKTDETDVFDGPDAIRRAGRNGGRMCNHTVLSIYRTEFMRANHIRQTDGRLMEDFESTPRIWFHARRFAYLDEVFYIYRRRSDSLTTTYSPRIVFDLVRQLRSLLDFVATHDIPPDILKIWSDQWVALLYWFIFHPVTSKKLKSSDRRKALDLLFEGKGKARFLSLCARCSAPKRAAVPLLGLAARGIQFPARFYFRGLYYPLLGLLHKNA